MKTEPDLRGLLELAGQAFEPPADGPDRVLAQIRQQEQAGQSEQATASPGGRHVRWARARPALMALAGVSVIGALVVGLHAGLAGHSSSSGSASSASRAMSGTAPLPAAVPVPSAGGSANGTVGGKPVRSSPVPGQQARVVQTAQVALQVPAGKVPATLDRLASIATGLGGYVGQSRLDEGVGPAAGTITLRVPVAAYPAASAQARAVGHVSGSSSQAQDVTAQYVDLGARISALQQTRATYLTLLSKASSIGDTLSVQQQIQDVQTRIEQLQGQQRLLADTSDLATIAVTVTEPGAAPPPAPRPRSGFGAAFHHAISGFATGLQAIIAISGPVLLVLLVLALGALLGRAGYRLVQRRLL